MRLLTAELPVMKLLKTLPVPLIAVEPVRIRFSTLPMVAREKPTLETTVSRPALAASEITSVVVSTM